MQCVKNRNAVAHPHCWERLSCFVFTQETKEGPEMKAQTRYCSQPQRGVAMLEDVDRQHLGVGPVACWYEHTGCMACSPSAPRGSPSNLEDTEEQGRASIAVAAAHPVHASPCGWPFRASNKEMIVEANRGVCMMGRKEEEGGAKILSHLCDLLRGDCNVHSFVVNTHVV